MLTTQRKFHFWKKEKKEKGKTTGFSFILQFAVLDTKQFCPLIPYLIISEGMGVACISAPWRIKGGPLCGRRKTTFPEILRWCQVECSRIGVLTGSQLPFSVSCWNICPAHFTPLICVLKQLGSFFLFLSHLKMGKMLPASLSVTFFKIWLHEHFVSLAVPCLSPWVLGFFVTADNSPSSSAAWGKWSARQGS